MSEGLYTSTLNLAFVDFTKPFKLHTDASTIGLGGVLYQDQDGKDRVITHILVGHSPKVNPIILHTSWNY